VHIRAGRAYKKDMWSLRVEGSSGNRGAISAREFEDPNIRRSMDPVEVGGGLRQFFPNLFHRFLQKCPTNFVSLSKTMLLGNPRSLTTYLKNKLAMCVASFVF
jgi:hypothetical protein